MMVNYLKRVGWGRILVMIVGNVFVGAGVGIFKLSGLGNDPFSGMVMALSEVVGIRYANFLILLNLALLVIEFLFGRKLIGAGTVVNATLLGYVATFFFELLGKTAGAPQSLFWQIVTVCLGVIVCGFGLSLYQSSDVGVAPYDSLSLIQAERWPKLTYFWHRMADDALCALICYLAGGIVGLAFGLGPVVQFFNRHFTDALLTRMKDRKKEKII